MGLNTLKFISSERNEFLQITLASGAPPRDACFTPSMASHSSPQCNVPTKIIFIISRYLTVQELECLKSHGKVEFFSYLADTDWKYIILDIRIELDRQWIISNISNINEFVVIVTHDDPSRSKWLKTLIDNEYVTNVLKKIPIIMDDSFDRRVINNVWLPNRKFLCCLRSLTNC